jgi:hypothetical protein
VGVSRCPAPDECNCGRTLNYVLEQWCDDPLMTAAEIVSVWIRFGKRSRRLRWRELRVIATQEVLMRSTSPAKLRKCAGDQGRDVLNERDVQEVWGDGNPNPTITASDLQLEGLLRR